MLKIEAKIDVDSKIITLILIVVSKETGIY